MHNTYTTPTQHLHNTYTDHTSHPPLRRGEKREERREEKRTSIAAICVGKSCSSACNCASAVARTCPPRVASPTRFSRTSREMYEVRMSQLTSLVMRVREGPGAPPDGPPRPGCALGRTGPPAAYDGVGYTQWCVLTYTMVYTVVYICA